MTDEQRHTGEPGPSETSGPGQMSRPGEENPSEAELTRLADGTLPEPERAALQARVAGSPELQTRLRAQERAVALVQQTGGIAAPPILRGSIEELADGAGFWHSHRASSGDRRTITLWRPRALAGLVALAVALVVVVSVTLHGTATPTVQRTAQLALATATGPAPATDPADRDLLSVRASGIAFPSYVRTSGWQASGVRHDRLDGRRVTTVFYYSGAARVGYSIVSGPPLPLPGGSTVHGRGGVVYVLASSHGARLITWRRDGHTCVIASRTVGRGTLLALAAADEQV